jgi:hypothetical protein
MSWTLNRESSRTILFFAAVTFVVGAAFLFGLQPSQVEANDDKKVAVSTTRSLGTGTTFPANGGTLGPIPDGGVLPYPWCTARRDIYGFGDERLPDQRRT